MSNPICFDFPEEEKYSDTDSDCEEGQVIELKKTTRRSTSPKYIKTMAVQHTRFPVKKRSRTKKPGFTFGRRSRSRSRSRSRTKKTGFTFGRRSRSRSRSRTKKPNFKFGGKNELRRSRSRSPCNIRRRSRSRSNERQLKTCVGVKVVVLLLNSRTELIMKENMKHRGAIYDILFPFRKSVSIINHLTYAKNKNRHKDKDDCFDLFNWKCLRDGVNGQVERFIDYLKNHNGRSQTVFVNGLGDSDAKQTEYGENCRKIVQELRRRGAATMTYDHKLSADFFFNPNQPNGFNQTCEQIQNYQFYIDK